MRDVTAAGMSGWAIMGLGLALVASPVLVPAVGYGLIRSSQGGAGKLAVAGVLVAVGAYWFITSGGGPLRASLSGTPVGAHMATAATFMTSVTGQVVRVATPAKDSLEALAADTFADITATLDGLDDMVTAQQLSDAPA